MKPVTAETVQAEIRRLEDFTACTTRPLSLTEEFHLQCLRQLLSVLNPAPQIDNDGWIEWGGGLVAPVTGMVEVRLRSCSNARKAEPATDWVWKHRCTGDDIIAYRVIEHEN